MRRLAWIAVLTFAVSVHANSKSDGLTLRWQKSEHSRDSNGTDETFTLDGDQLSWKWDYRGHHPNPKFVRHREKNVKVAHPDQLLSSLAPALLDGKTVTLKGSGHTTLDIALTVIRSGKTTHLTLRGPAPDDDKDPHFTAADALHDQLSSLVGD